RDAVLVAHPDLDGDERHTKRGLGLLGDDLAVNMSDIALEGGASELHPGVPHHPIVAGPEAQVVQRPGAHRGAIAISTRDTDLSALLPVHMAARGPEVEPIPLAGIELRSFLIEAEAFDPTGILIDPGILHARRCNPLKGAPDVEQERAVFS